MQRRIQFISDLHLEFYKQEIILTDFVTPCAPNLAILGDLGYPSNDNFTSFLRQASDNYQKIFFISGNHEFYNSIMNETNNEIIRICKTFSNVYYLDNDEHVLDDNTVILGTTLWTDIPISKRSKVKNSLNDYLKIFVQEQHYRTNITPEFTTTLHHTAVKWLENKINKYYNKEIIILTHHLPSFKLIHSKYEGKDINYAFASDLDYLMENNGNIKYWLCGHTHDCMKIKINNCICITNPLGYPGENEHLEQQKIQYIE